MHNADDNEFVKELRAEYRMPYLQLTKEEIPKLKAARAERRQREAEQRKELADYLNRSHVPVPEGAVMTKDLGTDIRCRTMRCTPSDWANTTVTLVKSTPALLERFGLTEWDTVEDPEHELGRCIVIGGVICYQEDYLNNEGWNSFQSTRTGFKPYPWFEMDDIRKVAQAFATGDRVRRALNDPASLAKRVEQLEATR
jgi:hypothetical protein